MTARRAKDLLDRFSAKRVLVVGDLMLDRYVLGTVERISPEAPVPVLHEQEVREMPGGAGNTARNVAALGGRATLLGAVGTDRAGERLSELLAADSVRPILVADLGRPTTQKTRFLQKSHQLLRVDTENRAHLAPGVEAQVIGILRDELAAHDAVIVSDYAKGFLTTGVARCLTGEEGKKSCLVAADVKPRQAALFAGVTLMSPNEREAHEFLGLDSKMERLAAPELAAAVAKEFATDAYVTLGELGIEVYARNQESGLAPQVHAREVFDVSGAGDTAISALTLALSAGASPLEAAQFANAACAVVVAKVGAATAAPDEVIAAFQGATVRVGQA